MPGLSPADAAAAWKAGLSNAVPKIQKKVQAITDSPMEAAAAQQDYMLRRLQEAVTSGRWAAALRAVPLSTWKSAILGKGLQNMQNGLTDGAAKVQAFQAMARPIFDAIHAQVKSMPKDGTLASSLARVQVAIEGMKQLKGRKS